MHTRCQRHRKRHMVPFVFKEYLLLLSKKGTFNCSEAAGKIYCKYCVDLFHKTWVYQYLFTAQTCSPQWLWCTECNYRDQHNYWIFWTVKLKNINIGIILKRNIHNNDRDIYKNNHYNNLFVYTNGKLSLTWIFVYKLKAII